MAESTSNVDQTKEHHARLVEAAGLDLRDVTEAGQLALHQVASLDDPIVDGLVEVLSAVRAPVDRLVVAGEALVKAIGVARAENGHQHAHLHNPEGAIAAMEAMQGAIDAANGRG